MKHNKAWAAVVVLSVFSTAILAMAGFVAGKPITLKTTMVRAVEQSSAEQCRKGLGLLGLHTEATGAIAVAKPLSGSLREGALDISMALQACPAYRIEAACVGEKCLDGRPGVSLKLTPRVVN